MFLFDFRFTKKVGPADLEDAANLAVLAGPDSTMATRTKGACP